VTFKCRRCRGKGKFRKTVIDSKIKSTTHCKTCKGRGFIVPDDRFPPRKGQAKTPDNPVIKTEDLENIGTVIKASAKTPEADDNPVIKQEDLENLENVIKETPSDE
jgi:DnaJ-class molecular chaperone